MASQCTNNKVCKLCGKPAECLCSIGDLCKCQPLCKKCTDRLYIGVSPFDSIDKEVIEFINRRFKEDCNWKSGNCYYFAIILKERFSDYEPEIYYDVLDGHFICRIQSTFYDWGGVTQYDSEYSKKYIIKWDDFKEYDELQYKRIINDVIK